MANSSFLGLIQNISLLLTSALFFDLLIRRKTTKKFNYWHLPIGLLLGITGVALMLTSWTYKPGIIFDTRSVLLGISGLFFGIVPTLIAMVMTAGFRIYQGGAATLMGVCVIFASGTIGILVRTIWKKPRELLKGWQLYLFGVAIHVVMLACAFVLPIKTALDIISNIYLPVLVIYPLGTLFLGLLMVNRLHRDRVSEELATSEARLRILAEILQKPVGSVKEFLDLALEHALQLTNSKFGYFLFYSEESQEIEFGIWSKEAVGELDTATAQNRYTLETIGFWGEPIRQRKPVMINQFLQSNSLIKDGPMGHVSMSNILTIPIFNEGKIMAVAGIANKPNDYNETDQLQLTLLMDGVWKATQQKLSEDRLHQSNETAQAILNASPDSIFILLENDGTIIAANEAASQLFRMQSSELVNKNFLEGSVPKLIKSHKERFSLVLHECKSEHFEDLISNQWFEFNYYPILEADGSVRQVVIHGRDITERKQAEKIIQENQQELKQLLAEAEQSRHVMLSLLEDQKEAEEKIRKLNLQLEQRVQRRTAQLEVANKELESFAYSVSHDLRAPLRAMDGFSSLLLADYQNLLDENGKHYLNRIQEAANRMGQLIDDLLNLSRVTRSALTLQEVNLSSLALSIADEILAANPSKNIEIEVAPRLIGQADPNLLRIVLVNLLDNAVKFSGKRSNPKITVGSTKINNEIAYFVQDNGVGFNMAFVDKLFAPFQRLHNSTEYPGTGIGLVIVQRIIARHGGKVWTEAVIDKGATFYFTLGGKSDEVSNKDLAR